MKTNKKSQISIEFVTIVSFLLIVTNIIVFSVLIKIQDQTKDESFQNIREIAYEIKSEIEAAENVHDGYIRNFILPETINGKNYTILTFKNYWVTVRTNDQEFVVNTNYFEGNITKNNTIRKINGIVKINQ